MSRIIKSLLKSVKIKSKLDSLIVFLNLNKLDTEILNLNTKLISIDRYNTDKVQYIDANAINHSSAFLPDAVICSNLLNYPNAKNLANILKLPQINIIKEHISIKLESALDCAKNQWINDINLVSSKDIADKLFITNFDIISDNLEKQILEKVNNWKPV